MSKISTLNVLSELKSLIWARGWTYAELAKKLGMSESGLKKVMTNSDISLGRLTQICEVCQIELSEVLNAADQERISEVYLSPEQEQFLLKNPKAFRFYWKLRVDQMTRGEFQKKYKTEIQETQKWIGGLEKIGLLKISPRGQIEFTHQGLIRWNSESPLVKYLHSLWSQQLIERVVNKNGPSDFINLSGLYLDPVGLAELRQECLEIFDRYSKLSQRLKTQKSALRVGFLATFTQFDFDLND